MIGLISAYHTLALGGKAERTWVLNSNLDQIFVPLLCFEVGYFFTCERGEVIPQKTAMSIEITHVKVLRTLLGR
jgi:hypothetical protein